MDQKLKILVYILIAILIIGLLILTIFPGTLRALSDSTKSTNDKCSPAQGYTPEAWREHMSHHPSIYKECLT